MPPVLLAASPLKEAVKETQASNDISELDYKNTYIAEEDPYAEPAEEVEE